MTHTLSCHIYRLDTFQITQWAAPKGNWWHFCSKVSFIFSIKSVKDAKIKQDDMLTAPQSLMTRTFWGSCCPSVREMLVLCITVLLAPGLGPVWAEATVDISGMFLWVASYTCVSGPSLICPAAFRRCCNSCCWFCWGGFHCWVGPGLGACCCWVRPLDICSRVLTLGPGAGVWAPPLGGARVLG